MRNGRLFVMYLPMRPKYLGIYRNKRKQCTNVQNIKVNFEKNTSVNSIVGINRSAVNSMQCFVATAQKYEPKDRNITAA